MNDASSHLTEEELQSLADGTLAPERVSAARAHLAACPACAGDVARLESLIKQTRESAPPTTDVNARWPEIRSRIERSKLVPLAAPDAVLPGPSHRHHIGVWLASAAAAAVVIVAVLASLSRPVATSPAGQAAGPEVTVLAASDSAREYEQEAQSLLNDLELRKSMLRPETKQLFERDLRQVDNAIAELEGAIAHDPRNGVLRQLLASSYRQKLDILKRIENAS